MLLHPSTTKLYGKPDAASIRQLLGLRAETHADKMALGAPGLAPLSYGGLLRQVDHTVEALRSFGVRPDDRVAVVLPNGPEMAVAFLAVAAAAACAPLNPAYRDTEFEFYLSDLGAKALIVLAGIDLPARTVATKLNIPIIDLQPEPSGEAGVFELVGTRQAQLPGDGFTLPQATALVLHTSGTTARPKLVPLSHANLCTSGHNIAITLDLTERDRCLNVMPLFHIHGLIGAILSSLTAGAGVVCTPGFDPGKFFEWVDTCQPTWYSAVPTMHQAILARAPANREIITRRPLRFIRSSSAALPTPVMAALEETLGAPVIESYGMTEAAHQMASNPLPPRPRKPGSVGVAAGPDVAIMDDSGRLLPAGETGEVVIRGPNVTKGYEANPKANQSAFTDGWFRTGDQGRLDPEGYLFLTGRLKEIINRGGEKIAPKEVDDVLLSHPAVAQAIAFARPHPTLGEDVAAAVVLKSNAAATEDEIRQFASTRLADFKVPGQVVIVDEIPKGPTGKLQRIGLAEKLAAKLQKDFVAAGTPVEKQVAEVWAKMLRLEHVGVRDNFFVLGGDSLSASTMILEIETRFKKAISVDRFLRSPTVDTIARLIEQKESSDSETLAGAPEGGARPIEDSFLSGLRNRLFQIAALYAPGFKTTRVWLHRMRGVSIGTNVSIGLGVLIETAYPRLVSIGNNVSIGMRAIIIGHLRDLTVQARTQHERTVRIEDDVYIGPGVIVLPNVVIGRGSVVSAGSVVSRSVSPRTLVRGNPARPVAHCGVPLGGGVSYEQFLRHLEPIEGQEGS